MDGWTGVTLLSRVRSSKGFGSYSSSSSTVHHCLSTQCFHEIAEPVVARAECNRSAAGLCGPANCSHGLSRLLTRSASLR